MDLYTYKQERNNKCSPKSNENEKYKRNGHQLSHQCSDDTLSISINSNYHIKQIYQRCKQKSHNRVCKIIKNMKS